jgi:hypothetical protein
MMEHSPVFVINRNKILIIFPETWEDQRNFGVSDHATRIPYCAKVQNHLQIFEYGKKFCYKYIRRQKVWLRKILFLS